MIYALSGILLLILAAVFTRKQRKARFFSPKNEVFSSQEWVYPKSGQPGQQRRRFLEVLKANVERLKAEHDEKVISFEKYKAKELDLGQQKQGVEFFEPTPPEIEALQKVVQENDEKGRDTKLDDL